MSTNKGTDLDKLVVILVWITVLSIGLVFGGIKFYFSQADMHSKSMGEACLHHVHNLAASADANLKDIYSFNNFRRNSPGVSPWDEVFPAASL